MREVRKVFFICVFSSEIEVSLLLAKSLLDCFSGVFLGYILVVKSMESDEIIGVEIRSTF